MNTFPTGLGRREKEEQCSGHFLIEIELQLFIPQSWQGASADFLDKANNAGSLENVQDVAL